VSSDANQIGVRAYGEALRGSEPRKYLNDFLTRKGSAS